MNIKIQGGGSGTYANTGSCTGVTTYLQHEDLERMKNGREVQPFFNNSRDYISAQEVTFKIDNNKAKLSRNDAKFYVITVSPSSRELEKMGKTEKEQAEAMRRYVRGDAMQHYAEGFGKGLNKEDIEYYGKIHFERKGADRYDMHAHIIVSRKDRSNTRKLSPKTNHTGKKNCGNVKGGFDRTDFFRKCESSFDKRTGYDRAPEQTFDYLNTMKNGSPKEIFQKKEWAKRVNHERLEKMKHRRVAKYRRKLGVVFQDFRLLKDRNVYENVAFAQRVIGRPTRVIRKRVPEVLQEVGLAGKYKAYPDELSGGEQQRVALARALVNRPDILLADEPTGNLDPKTSEEIMALMEQINDRGTTVLVVTHNKDIVNAMRKRVVTMHNGKIISDEKEGGYHEA